MKPALALTTTLTVLTAAFALSKQALAQTVSAPKSALAVKTQIAAASSPTALAQGQSVIMCESTTGNVINAVAAINQKLVTSRRSLALTAGGILVSVDEPYSVSAPAITSYDRAGNDDVACVTITKQ